MCSKHVNISISVKILILKMTFITYLPLPRCARCDISQMGYKSMYTEIQQTKNIVLYYIITYCNYDSRCHLIQGWQKKRLIDMIQLDLEHGRHDTTRPANSSQKEINTTRPKVS